MAARFSARWSRSWAGVIEHHTQCVHGITTNIADRKKADHRAPPVTHRLPADHHGGAPDDDITAMSSHVTHSCSGHVSYHHSRRPLRDRVWRPNARTHVAYAGCRQEPDQNCRAACRKDGTSDMRHWPRIHHRANMHIRNSRGGRHGQKMCSAPAACQPSNFGGDRSIRSDNHSDAARRYANGLLPPAMPSPISMNGC